MPKLADIVGDTFKESYKKVARVFHKAVLPEYYFKRPVLENIQDLVNSLPDFGNKTMISYLKDKKRQKISFNEMHERANAYAKAFYELGLKKGDRIALLSRNNPRWLELNLGINNAVMFDVPREIEKPKEGEFDEGNWILKHSGAKIVIVEDKKTYDLVKKRRSIEHIISIERIAGVMNIEDLLQIGRNSNKVLPKAQKDDLASIIYTSGTTGRPKGVMLTHENYMSNVQSALIKIKLDFRDKFLSFMSAWHVYERLAKYAGAIVGAETAYSSDVRFIRADLKREKPTVMACVPRVWELVYNNIMDHVRDLFGENTKEKLDAMIQKDIDNMKQFGEDREIPIALKQVYKKVRKILGGNLKKVISGGASLREYLKDFFYAAGFRIAEGYGTTETSPLIAGDTQDLSNLYSVSIAIPGVSVEIRKSRSGRVLKPGEIGEIWVKGPNVMKGYYKNKRETEKVLKNGWYNTGDLGYLDDMENLKITGRGKDNVKTKDGKWINLRSIEEKLENCKLVGTAVAYAKDWVAPGALILPNIGELEGIAINLGIKYNKKDRWTLVDNQQVVDEFLKRIKLYMGAESTSPKQYSIITRLEEGYGLTKTKKVKRDEVSKIYAFNILDMSKKINR